MYTLRLLGGFAVEGANGGASPRLTQRRAEALLAVLALAGDLGCTRHRLLGMLWPDFDEARARHSLRDALHVIRQALGADAVLGEGDTLRLNPAVVTADVVVFTRALEKPSREEGLRTYRGPLLQGFFLDGAPEFEQWIEAERTRLAREYAEAIEQLATEAEGAGRHREAASWWARAIEHDPYNTRLVIRRMRALVAAGDRANALIEADAHTRRLRAELEIEPDPALATEVAAIRNGGGVAAPATTVRPAPQVAVLEPAVGAGTEATSSPAARPWRWIGIGAAVTVVATLAAGWWWTQRTPPLLDVDRVAILPLTTTSANPALRAEAAHVQQVVTRFLQHGPAPLAVGDAGATRAAGAALVLSGSLDSTAGGRALTLTLVELPRRLGVARRTATVRPESLDAAAERLALEMLALEAGQPTHRLPELLRHDAAAVREYLGSIRQPSGDVDCKRMVTEVWRVDSTLVYPGLDCLRSAGLLPWRGRNRWYDTVAANVWRHRSTLVKEDRAFTDALVGPWFGLAANAEDRIALWEMAANTAPAWWLPRAHLAFMLADLGPMTTIPDWRLRAQGALLAALDASDWSRLPVLEAAFWFALTDGDSVLARRARQAAETRARHQGAGWTTPWGGWWFASVADMPLLTDAAFGPGDRAAAWCEDATLDESARLARMLFALARAVPRVAPAADALASCRERKMDDRQRHPTEWWHGIHWRTRGRYDPWITYRARDYRVELRALSSALDFTAVDAGFLRAVLYLGAPEDTLALAAVARLRRIVDGDSVPTPDPGVTGIAHCWLAQWRLAHRDTTGVVRAITYLRDLDTRDRAARLDGWPGSARWVVCPALLEALLAQGTGRVALDRARALDRTIAPMPIPPRTFADALDQSATHDHSRWFLENLLAARLLASAGDTAAALAAARRRPWWPPLAEWFEMPTEYLRLEGRLASALADTLGAMRAYEQYLGLRAERPSHPPWAAEWDSVRAELAALTREER